MSIFAAVFAIAACTRVADRVIEPVGAGDASTTGPEAADASLSPIGPIARTPEREPAPDFSLVRSPELGLQDRARLQSQLADRVDDGLPRGGNSGTGGGGGSAGSDRRPVSTGGQGYL
jgi:hypothetical protein